MFGAERLGVAVTAALGLGLARAVQQALAETPAWDGSGIDRGMAKSSLEAVRCATG
jgi:hypothetical protein